MFNLVVGTGARDDRQCHVSRDRVFEYTNDGLEDRFRTNGELNITALSSIPTLFMEEGMGDEVARIGWINRIENEARDYKLHYMFDASLPALSNSQIYELRNQLGMRDFEFSRHHWAIKEVDLFYVLFRQQTQLPFSPTVFQLSERPVNPNLVSVMMPFSDGFNIVYDTIKTAVENEEFECRRADDFWVHPHIIQDIIELICTSSVVICDLSGKNPNVFYEAGIAHTLGKEVILLTQAESDVPFDLRSLRYIKYLNNGDGRGGLARDIAMRLNTLNGR